MAARQQAGSLKWIYQRVDNSTSSDTEEEEFTQPKTIHRVAKIHFIWGATLILSVLITWAFTSHLPGLSAHDTTIKHCGNSTAEAKAQGCILDIISRVWLPEECYDAPLTDEFARVTDWHWYADANQQEEISREVVEQGGGPDPLYVTNEYHYVHCAYMWMKLHRAVTRIGPVDTYIGNYNHTRHCGTNLVNHVNEGNISNARFYLVYASCPVASSPPLW